MSRIFYCNQILSKQAIGRKFDYRSSFYVLVLPFRGNNSGFKKYKYVTETNFDLQFDIVLVQERFNPI